MKKSEHKMLVKASEDAVATLKGHERTARREGHEDAAELFARLADIDVLLCTTTSMTTWAAHRRRWRGTRRWSTSRPRRSGTASSTTAV